MRCWCQAELDPKLLSPRANNFLSENLSSLDNDDKLHCLDAMAEKMDTTEDGMTSKDYYFDSYAHFGAFT